MDLPSVCHKYSPRLNPARDSGIKVSVGDRRVSVLVILSLLSGDFFGCNFLSCNTLTCISGFTTRTSPRRAGAKSATGPHIYVFRMNIARYSDMSFIDSGFGGGHTRQEDVEMSPTQSRTSPSIRRTLRQSASRPDLPRSTTPNSGLDRGF